MPTPKEDFITRYRYTIIAILLVIFIGSWMWLFYSQQSHDKDYANNIAILSQRITDLEAKVDALSIKPEVAGVSSEPTTPIVSEVQSNSAKININTASQAELETLTGIGPTKATDIISYREENGDFSSIDEILNVKGIGEATLEKIREEITVE